MSKTMSQSSNLAVDPVSDVLSLLRPRSCLSGGLNVGGEWAFFFPADGAFRCFTVMTGRCWLSFADRAEPIRLNEGDFVALPQGREFALASDPGIAPLEIYKQVNGSLEGRLVQVGGGGACFLFGAVFSFRPDVASCLFGSLPTVLLLVDGEDRPILKAYLDRMATLLRDSRPGATLVRERLAETMLIDFLRLHFADKAGICMGWLSALQDGRIGRAVIAMHEQPGRRWTVRQLAERAGMSRSAFAFRFKEKAGISVMEYFVRWRMLLAADRLVRTADSICVIANDLGYKSESAFVSAFRREIGWTPREYGRHCVRKALMLRSDQSTTCL